MIENWDVKAVLLDMDGTLLDTERVYLSALAIALIRLGYPDPMRIGHAMVGLPGPECDNILCVAYGADFPLEEFRKLYVRERDEILKDGLPLKPGATELLDALRDAKLPMALVTASSRQTAEEHLTSAHIRSRFEHILTRDDVARSKPSPDLYLLAAARLDVQPVTCVAIEDSGPGIASAHSAGTIPIMVPDILQPNEETRAKCAAIVSDLHEALTILRLRAGWGRAGYSVFQQSGPGSRQENASKSRI